MYRHPGLREIVIADRKHPHDRKHASQRGQFVCRSDTNCAMTLHVEARQFICIGQFFMQRGVIFENCQIHVSNKFQ
ncbi:hypothetical protein SDC9_175337 [bioreactor metagenome]|uniref:Uncharacterized protein n=1 Tax=bioreactor metagenome TaxID=1076179 RepID=A0A645GW74_9ZZZZ